MTNEFTPFPFIWDGEAMKPTSSFWAKKADERFVIGMRYTMLEHHERSAASHAHFFAAINDAWMNLPDHLALQFPTAEILRQHALIMTGYRRERKFIASSAAEARKIALWLHPQSISDDYAIISVNKNVVIEWKAKSQSYRRMAKGQFQKSKEAVLGFLASLIEVTPAELSAAAGQAA